VELKIIANVPNVVICRFSCRPEAGISATAWTWRHCLRGKNKLVVNSCWIVVYFRFILLSWLYYRNSFSKLHLNWWIFH